jgi:hypothetical protein
MTVGSNRRGRRARPPRLVGPAGEGILLVAT